MNRVYLGFIIAALLIGLNLFQKINLTKLTNQITALNEELAIIKNKNTLCNAYLEKQNLAIKELEIKQNLKPNKKIEDIEKIKPEDKSCEAELKAYKRLFDE